MDAYSKTERHSFEVANEYYRKSERLLRLPCAQPTNLPPSALCIAECESAREFRSAQCKNNTQATFPKRGRA